MTFRCAPAEIEEPSSSTRADFSARVQGPPPCGQRPPTGQIAERSLRALSYVYPPGTLRSFRYVRPTFRSAEPRHRLLSRPYAFRSELGKMFRTRWRRPHRFLAGIA